MQDQRVRRKPSEKSVKNMWMFMATATGGKCLINTAKRMMYPFAPAIARGLGVNLGSVTSIIAINQAASIVAPAIVVLGDRIGYRLLLLFAFMLFSIGMFAAGFLPIYSIVMICFLLAGFSKSIIDPVFQAIAGNMVPFEKRGMAIGIMEIAWAGSTLIGLPLTGLVIEKYNWQTPFQIYGVLSLICFLVVLKVFPKDDVQKKNKLKQQNKTIQTWKNVLRFPKVRAMLLFAFFMCLANDNLFVIYGAWLEDDFGLTLTAIGFGTVFIGLSEVLGEILTAFFADRMGLKRSMTAGAVLTGLSYYLLIFLGSSLGLVLLGLFFVFLTFEFTIVTSMSLSTELVPELRATTMSLYFAAAGIGRVIGALSGGILWGQFGITGVCILSGTATFIGFFVLVSHYHKPFRIKQ
ncbi:MAG: MFS transporter [Desulfobacula sp.]|nr:MFS transporter [Desulfobacula sp.]